MVARVALTFDAEHPDRPTRAGVIEAQLETLERESVRATFFLQGRWVEAYPQTARRVAQAGHLVASHSHYHARLPSLLDRGIRQDVRAAERVIRRVCGVDPRPWFRCPFGAGEDDRRVLLLLAGLGYRHVGWNVDSGDWRPRTSARRLERDVLAGIEGVGDGAVVLFHGWPTATALALPGLLVKLRQRDFHFVGVDELVGA